MQIKKINHHPSKWKKEENALMKLTVISKKIILIKNFINNDLIKF